MSWIKSHKLVSILLLIIVFFYFKDNLNFPILPTSNSGGVYQSESLTSARKSVGFDLAQAPSALPQTSNASSRIIVQESNMSLLVTDVKGSGEKVLAFTKNSGGYMVSASYDRPSESPFETITVRIPTNKLDQALSYFRSLAAKVTNENLVGTDVTDQYTDIEARLTTLRKTQAKFEEILTKAISVQDILTVQRELINLQDEIDSYVGQQKATVKNAELTKVIVYLSADEIALPYTPDNVFRPDVVFKYAVRSLVGTLTKIAEALIWIVVYSPLIIVVVIIYIFFRRWRRKNISKSSN
jgi:hypothetical protein